MREIIIRPVLNGFVVRVGCSELAFNCQIDFLAQELIRYHRDPEGVEKEYTQRAVNRIENAVVPREGGIIENPPQVGGRR